MALFYPTMEKIKQFKVQPTDGEWALLDFLEKVLDDSFEVYFTPFLNGDRPDVLIMRKGYGVMVIEVKDWNLDNFKLNEKKKWVYIPNNSVVKSPIDQVLKYKNNLFDLHVPDLLQVKIKDFRNFNIVSCAVYFHCASQFSIKEMLITPFKEDKKYQTFLKYNIDFLGFDSLDKDNFYLLLRKRFLIAEQSSCFFTDTIYNNFKRILSPAIHLQSQGEAYSYSEKQIDIIYSKTLEQRVSGVFGSGKTTVLAARAVQAYKRALARNNNPRILILTFNITLKNFIHDKMNKVHETFPIESFVIINYHQFINAELNNLNIEFDIPEGTVDISKYLETNYYGNIKLFEDHKSEIVKYDAVLIDEIQDYHRAWMDIIKNYFRDPNGDYVLFGDVKQNIYGQATINKDVVTNVKGVNKLKYCFRSGFKVCDLAQSFQRNIFADKYDIDDFSENGKYRFFGQEEEKEGYINYMYLQNANPIPALYNIIRGNILNKNKKISPNDITILGYTTNLLRFFDLYYRYSSRERTNSMLETVEIMYMIHLNYIGKNNDNNPNSNWFNNITKHLKKKLFPNRKQLFDNDIIILRQHIATLFSVFDLYENYKNSFKSRLDEECKRCSITFNAFIAFREYYKKDLEKFINDVYSDNYKNIRDNKKLHFWMNSGTIKISTINSFKGWESEVVFLIIEPKYETSTLFNMSFDELLYTGLTRCKRNLVIINFGNEEYDLKMRPLIDQIK
ncbi:putative uncharacterized protein [Bacteroides sp. CAG:462]|nr:putative uncharacterized protein [Bacteroides sp. CAG:462]